MSDSKASDHVKPCDIAKSELHNRRDEDYLNAINKDKIYIRRDLIPNNESYVSPAMKGIDLQTYYEQIKVMVKEKTGRAMQEKDVVYKKKNGKEGIRKGSSPIRESVVNITADTNMEQLQHYTENVERRWGIRAIQIHIHRDEGHYENPEDASSWKPNLHAHIIWDWMDHSTGKSWKLNADDMSELQDMVAETLQMARGTSKTETNLEHLERNDYIIHKQENKKKLLEEEQKKALAEKKAAEAQVAKIKEQVSKAETEKATAEQDKKKAVADKEDAERECAKAVAKKDNIDKECKDLDEKCNGLVDRYNSIADRYNDTIHSMQHWRNAEGWQLYLLDYFSDIMYKSDKLIRYAVDSLISFANNSDGRGGHQDILHDDQSASVKMVLERFSPSDKSVWQKVAAWLLGLSKRFGQLSVDAVIRASRELDDVVNGKYDWRIERFVRGNGLNR